MLSIEGPVLACFAGREKPSAGLTPMGSLGLLVAIERLADLGATSSFSFTVRGLSTVPKVVESIGSIRLRPFTSGAGGA